MQLRISVATEGPTDAAVARALLRACGLDVDAEHGGAGKDRLDQRLPGYNRAAASRFLGVSAALCPANPDASADPKRDLIALARKGRRDVRVDMVPRTGHVVQVGPAYTSRLIEFAERNWDPDRAAKRSDSLKRCLAAVRRLR